MKMTRCEMCITMIIITMTTLCLSVFGQMPIITNRVIDKQAVLLALQGDFELAARSRMFTGESRRQADTYLIQILDDYAEAVGTDAPLQALQEAFGPRDVSTLSQADALLSHLLTWLARPANAEALIGVNNILLLAKRPQQRKACLSFLDKIESQRLCLPLTNALSRLKHYFLQASPATPNIGILMASALAQNGNDTGKDMLFTTLNDNKADYRLQIECAKAMLFLDHRSTGVLANVNRLLDDAKVPVMFKAEILEVLYDVGNSRGMAWMEHLIQSTNAMQRIYAAEVLAKRGDIRGLDLARSIENEPQEILQARLKLLIRQHIVGAPERVPDISLLRWNSNLHMFETCEK